MASLTIELDEQTLKSLREIARENGFEAAETLLSQQVRSMVRSYRGQGLTPGLAEHLKASIQENLSLLRRLAQ